MIKLLHNMENPPKNTEQTHENYLLYNAKFFLVFLIVFGHFIAPFTEYNIYYKTLYLFIYTFHIPMFIFISGIFSKKEIAKEEIKKYTANLILPLIIFQTLYSLFDFYITDNFSFYNFIFIPYWILWYLLSLFFWKIILPYALKIKYILPVSILLSAIIGYLPIDGYFLSLSRTVVFFPIFLLGHYATPNFFSNIKFKGDKILSIFIIAGFLLFFYANTSIDYRWLYGAVNYNSLGNSQWYAGIYRLFLIAGSLLLGISAIKLIPAGKNYFTSLGKNSLAVYLWHGFIIKFFKTTLLIILIYKTGTAYSLAIILLASLAIALLLSQNLFTDFTKKYLK